MSTTDDIDTFDGRSDREVLEKRFGDRRHVLERIVTLDTALSDDAERILQILDEGSDQS